MPFFRFLLATALVLGSAAHALTREQALAIATGDTEARVAALNQAVADADDETAAFIQALQDDAVRYKDGQVFVMKDDKAHDPVGGAELRLPEDAEDVVNNNRVRGALTSALVIGGTLELLNNASTVYTTKNLPAVQAEVVQVEEMRIVRFACCARGPSSWSPRFISSAM